MLKKKTEKKAVKNQNVELRKDRILVECCIIWEFNIFPSSSTNVSVHPAYL